MFPQREEKKRDTAKEKKKQEALGKRFVSDIPEYGEKKENKIDYGFCSFNEQNGMHFTSIIFELTSFFRNVNRDVSQCRKRPE